MPKSKSKQNITSKSKPKSRKIPKNGSRVTPALRSEASALTRMFANTQMQSAPASRSRFIRTGGPKQTYLPNGDCVIEHRELFSRVTCFTNFTVGSQVANTAIPINPGNPNLFPWLAQIATGWESYVFESFEVLYIPACSSATAGNIYLAVDYDITDGLPTDELQVNAYRSTTTSTAWAENLFVAEREDLRKRKTYFVSPLPYIPAIYSTDVGLQMTGKLLCCSDSGANNNVGKLIVNYKVRLMTPHLNRTPTPFLTIDGSAGLSAVRLIPTTIFVTEGSSLNPWFVVDTVGNYIEFLRGGRYSADGTVGGTVLVAPVNSTIVAGSYTIVGGTYFSAVNAAGTNCTWRQIVDVTAGTRVTFSITGAATVTGSLISHNFCF